MSHRPIQSNQRIQAPRPEHRYTERDIRDDLTISSAGDHATARRRALYRRSVDDVPDSHGGTTSDYAWHDELRTFTHSVIDESRRKRRHAAVVERERGYGRRHARKQQLRRAKVAMLYGFDPHGVGHTVEAQARREQQRHRREGRRARQRRASRRLSAPRGEDLDKLSKGSDDDADGGGGESGDRGNNGDNDDGKENATPSDGGGGGGDGKPQQQQRPLSALAGTSSTQQQPSPASSYRERLYDNTQPFVRSQSQYGHRYGGGIGGEAAANAVPPPLPVRLATHTHVPQRPFPLYTGRQMRPEESAEYHRRHPHQRHVTTDRSHAHAYQQHQPQQQQQPPLHHGMAWSSPSPPPVPTLNGHHHALNSGQRPMSSYAHSSGTASGNGSGSGSARVRVRPLSASATTAVGGNGGSPYLQYTTAQSHTRPQSSHPSSSSFSSSSSRPTTAGRHRSSTSHARVRRAATATTTGAGNNSHAMMTDDDDRDGDGHGHIRDEEYDSNEDDSDDGGDNVDDEVDDEERRRRRYEHYLVHGDGDDDDFNIDRFVASRAQSRAASSLSTAKSAPVHNQRPSSAHPMAMSSSASAAVAATTSSSQVRPQTAVSSSRSTTAPTAVKVDTTATDASATVSTTDNGENPSETPTEATAAPTIRIRIKRSVLGDSDDDDSEGDDDDNDDGDHADLDNFDTNRHNDDGNGEDGSEVDDSHLDLATQIRRHMAREDRREVEAAKASAQYVRQSQSDVGRGGLLHTAMVATMQGSANDGGDDSGAYLHEPRHRSGYTGGTGASVRAAAVGAVAAATAGGGGGRQHMSTRSFLDPFCFDAGAVYGTNDHGQMQVMPAATAAEREQQHVWQQTVSRSNQQRADADGNNDHDDNDDDDNSERARLRRQGRPLMEAPSLTPAQQKALATAYVAVRTAGASHLARVKAQQQRQRQSPHGHHRRDDNPALGGGIVSGTLTANASVSTLPGTRRPRSPHHANDGDAHGSSADGTSSGNNSNNARKMSVADKIESLSHSLRVGGVGSSSRRREYHDTLAQSQRRAAAELAAAGVPAEQQRQQQQQQSTFAHIKASSGRSAIDDFFDIDDSGGGGGGGEDGSNRRDSHIGALSPGTSASSASLRIAQLQMRRREQQKQQSASAATGIKKRTALPANFVAQFGNNAGGGGIDVDPFATTSPEAQAEAARLQERNQRLAELLASDGVGDVINADAIFEDGSVPIDADHCFFDQQKGDGGGDGRGVDGENGGARGSDSEDDNDDSDGEYDENGVARVYTRRERRRRRRARRARQEERRRKREEAIVIAAAMAESMPGGVGARTTYTTERVCEGVDSVERRMRQQLARERDALAQQQQFDHPLLRPGTAAGDSAGARAALRRVGRLTGDDNVGAAAASSAAAGGGDGSGSTGLTVANKATPSSPTSTTTTHNAALLQLTGGNDYVTLLPGDVTDLASDMQLQEMELQRQLWMLSLQRQQINASSSVCDDVMSGIIADERAMKTKVFEDQYRALSERLEELHVRKSHLDAEDAERRAKVLATKQASLTRIISKLQRQVRVKQARKRLREERRRQRHERFVYVEAAVVLIQARMRGCLARRRVARMLARARERTDAVTHLTAVKHVLARFSHHNPALDQLVIQRYAQTHGVPQTWLGELANTVTYDAALSGNGPNDDAQLQLKLSQTTMPTITAGDDDGTMTAGARAAQAAAAAGEQGGVAGVSADATELSVLLDGMHDASLGRASRRPIESSLWSQSSTLPSLSTLSTDGTTATGESSSTTMPLPPHVDRRQLDDDVYAPVTEEEVQRSVAVFEAKTAARDAARAAAAGAGDDESAATNSDGDDGSGVDRNSELNKISLPTPVMADGGDDDDDEHNEDSHTSTAAAPAQTTATDPYADVNVFQAAAVGAEFVQQQQASGDAGGGSSGTGVAVMRVLADAPEPPSEWAAAAAAAQQQQDDARRAAEAEAAAAEAAATAKAEAAAEAARKRARARAEAIAVAKAAEEAAAKAAAAKAAKEQEAAAAAQAAQEAEAAKAEAAEAEAAEAEAATATSDEKAD